MSGICPSGTEGTPALSNDNELKARLSRSARILRGWNWMGTISTRQAEAIEILTEEGRLLIRLCVKHPDEANKIGRYIVAYRRMIDGIEVRRLRATN